MVVHTSTDLPRASSRGCKGLIIKWGTLVFLGGASRPECSMICKGAGSGKKSGLILNR